MTTGRFEPDKLIDFFRYFDEKNPFHLDAIKLLQEECEALDPDLMSDFTPWVRMYRNKGTQGVALKFTPRLFSNLTGYPEKRFDQEFCHDCAYLFERTGFSDHRDASRMLMANLLHESGRFRWMKELSNGLYLRGRSDLGHGPDQGELWKGAGVLQLTGLYNYKKFAAWLLKNEGIDDPNIVKKGADYVAEKYPFTSAIAWIEDNDLLRICLEEGFDACCYKINGGWNGYSGRLAYLEKCIEFMV
jgi:putative chitinase|tara:strand:- start:150 stop:884 length:735 start_codon:yes stop_codon:yes gene_type:complete